ncbi:SDR family oxidoreductase [Rhodococcus sp. WS3]|uniref:SDR family NAD(P)-dependent oxidoreductase n=1 Tax=Rhodococcus sp. WS3 TaxID=2486271 RepID=UPI00114138CD|nr:SDR family oxidoreductase [Rhodococcus sp. WS3]ROZ49038.1 SDR family oxidoreductase [Rhodococcus sp. WS3]
MNTPSANNTPSVAGSLQGRAIVVTGAGTGLGRAYAIAAGAAGARVLVNDIDAEAAQATATSIGDAAIAVAGSVSSWDDAARVIGACVESFGAIDGLVNNAGVLHAGPAWEDNETAIRRIVEVNVLGTMFCGVHALRAMIPRGSGSIVNIVSGAMLGIPHLSTYGATKGAIASLTWGWAVDTEGTGVRVNALSPVARTEMVNAWSLSDRTNDNNPDPDVIAPAAVYLLGDQSSGLHGQILRFNGRVVGLLSPPRVEVTSGERADWTVDGIASAVDAELADRLPGIGRGAAMPNSLI